MSQLVRLRVRVRVRVRGGNSLGMRLSQIQPTMAPVCHSRIVNVHWDESSVDWQTSSEQYTLTEHIEHWFTLTLC